MPDIPISGLHVLIVDDIQSARWAMKRALASCGLHNVAEAKDGAEALEKLRSESYQLVISDWEMRKVDGLELLAAIRNSEELRHIPFIMITGSVGKDAVVKALKAGVDDYIAKPFSAATLAEKIKSVMSARAQPPSSEQ